MSESVKAKQSQNLLLSEKLGLEKQLDRLNGSLETLKSRIAQSEEQVNLLYNEIIQFFSTLDYPIYSRTSIAQMKVHHQEVLSSIREDRHSAMNLEAAKWELADAEKELKMLKSTVSMSEKEHEQIQRKIDDIQTELHNERYFPAHFLV